MVAKQNTGMNAGYAETSSCCGIKWPATTLAKTLRRMGSAQAEGGVELLIGPEHWYALRFQLLDLISGYGKRIVLPIKAYYRVQLSQFFVLTFRNVDSENRINPHPWCDDYRI